MQISDQIVLITGASRGIGAACAAVFRSPGARLSLTARDEPALARNFTSQDPTVTGDITSADFRTQLIEGALERFGRIDIPIDNAGTGLYWPASTALTGNSKVVVTRRSGWLLIFAQRLFPCLMESRVTAFMKNVYTEAAG